VDSALLHGEKPEKVEPTKAESNCYIALSGSLRSSLASLASLATLSSLVSLVSLSSLASLVGLASLASLAPAGGEETNRLFSESANEDRLLTSKLKKARELVGINLKNAFE